jgi:hypothetical protein
MRNIPLIILLSALSLSVSAQTNKFKNTILTVSYTGDSTLLIEKYEINFNKKKVYYITPISNYLHVKGEKYRRTIKTSKGKWLKINDLVSKINFVHLDSLKTSKTDGPKYELEVFISDEMTDKFVLSKEDENNDLRKLFELVK